MRFPFRVKALSAQMWEGLLFAGYSAEGPLPDLNTIFLSWMSPLVNLFFLFNIGMLNTASRAIEAEIPSAPP